MAGRGLLRPLLLICIIAYLCTGLIAGKSNIASFSLMTSGLGLMHFFLYLFDFYS